MQQYNEQDLFIGKAWRGIKDGVKNAADFVVDTGENIFDKGVDAVGQILQGAKIDENRRQAKLAEIQLAQNERLRLAELAAQKEVAIAQGGVAKEKSENASESTKFIVNALIAVVIIGIVAFVLLKILKRRKQ